MLGRIVQLPAIRSFCQAVALCCTLCGAVFAAPGERAAAAGGDAKLQGLRARIAELTAQVAAGLKQRDALSAALRDADLAIPGQTQALAAVQREQAAVERHRAQLDAERAKVQSQFDAHRAALARAVRGAYRLGREPRMKLLLNQQDPATLGRMLAYEGYVGRAQEAQARALQADLARLQSLQQQVAEQGARLAALGEQATAQLDALQAARSQRAAALAALDRRVEDAHQQIARLQRDQAALEALLANLNRIAPEFNLGARQPFAAMQGKLPWPVQGRIAARFSDTRAGAGAVRWNGWLIDAEPGAKVRACYHGRVIYSDWLQGMGLLLIIDHGGGYLSLYGRAEILFKRVGDSVAPGDVIAALGEGTAPQLYVEIRHGRTALDPQKWFKRPRR